MQRDERVMTVRAAPARRAFSAAVLGALGLLQLWLGLVEATGAAWRAVLLAIGAGVLLAAWRLWQASAGSLILSRRGVHDESGRVLAPLASIASVERGPFAFKPSNGFAIILTDRLPGAWVPGMWWRLGRRVGVGGVIGVGQAKAMAEILETMVMERDAQDD